MKDTDATFARARIDGGFSFALAAFAIGLGLLTVLERVGLPDAALKSGVGVLVFSEFVVIAALLRSMRPVDFYAGGRALPAPYAGLAYAGLVAGLFLPFLPPLPQGLGFKSVAAGFCGGLICAAFASGPYLRGRGASSIADLAASRFPHLAARVAIAGVTAACGALVALAGYEIALDSLLSASGLDRPIGAALLGVLLVLLIVPGGLSGVIWLAAGAAVVTLAALGLPAALTLREPIFLAQATARLNSASGAGFELKIEPALVAAVALGLCALAPLFGPACASGDKSGARRGGLFALVFVAAIAALGALTMSRSTLALDSALVGQTPRALPSDILASSGAGEISICGIHSAASIEIVGSCASQADFDGHLRRADIGATARYLIANLPVLRRSGPTLTGLMAIFSVVLGVSLAAAGVQTFAASLGHDLLHPQRRRFGPASRRLALARGLAMLLVAFCAAILSGKSGDPRQAIGLALAISAALVAPLLALTLVPRATSFGALVALAVGALVMSTFFYRHGWIWPPDELAVNILFAALDAFLAGVFVSLLQGQDLWTPRHAAARRKDEPPGFD